jgi:hypothetical protein
MAEKSEALVAAARCALADLEGIMPEHEPGGERSHPAWRTIAELRAALEAPPPAAGLLDEALAALRGLYEHCAMIHKHWGEGDNTKQANAAQAAGLAVLEKVK